MKISRRALVAIIGGVLIVGCCGVLGLAYIVGSSPEARATSTAVAQARNDNATAQAIAVATEAARPTNTPEPTVPPRPTDTPEPTEPPTATLPPTNTPQPTNTLSPLTALTRQIEDDLGSSNREGVQRVSVEVIGELIFVTFAINDNLFTSLIPESMANDTLTILNAVNSGPVPYEVVRIEGTFSMRDAFGNVSEDVVLRALYNRTTVERINFDGLVEVFTIADEPAYIHPAILELEE